MTSWYQRKIVPHIVKLGCGCALMDERRQSVAPKAAGRVLELGIGAGANLRFYYAAKVTRLVGIEPSPELRVMAAEAARAAKLPLELVDASAEALPFESGSFDCVVCTFTLCSVDDAEKSLEEARRVLKSGGRFLFCEHGLSPDADMAKWQRRVEPIWKPVFGGCRLTRPVRGAIERVFAIESWTGAYQGEKPSLAGWMEWGEARAA